MELFFSSFDGIKITMRQLYTNTDDFRPLLKEIKKSGETRIILVNKTKKERFLNTTFDETRVILAKK
jgi:hypothetical protein